MKNELISKINSSNDELRKEINNIKDDLRSDITATIKVEVNMVSEKVDANKKEIDRIIPDGRILVESA